jgi:hypothetical protein
MQVYLLITGDNPAGIDGTVRRVYADRARAEAVAARLRRGIEEMRTAIRCWQRLRTLHYDQRLAALQADGHPPQKATQLYHDEVSAEVELAGERVMLHPYSYDKCPPHPPYRYVTVAEFPLTP